MKTIGKLMLILLSLSLLGFIFKIALIPGGGFLLILSLGLLSVLFLLQFILTFIKIKNNVTLTVLSLLMSLSLSLSVITVLFRYQWWTGWDFFYFLSTPLFVIMSILFFVFYNKIMTLEHKKYILKNIIVPWIFILIFGILPLIFSKKTFYETFNYRRQNMTYEKFVVWCNEQN